VLGRAGQLVPGSTLVRDRDLPWPSRFLWLTDMATPDRDALGLTMKVLDCDRTRYRYRATNNGGVVAWADLIAVNKEYAKLTEQLMTPGADRAPLVRLPGTGLRRLRPGDT